MDKPINEMTGDELVKYLHVLSAKRDELSKIKIQLTEELPPLQNVVAEKKAQITMVSERQKQCRVEISSCKYAIKGCAEGVS